jgi:hypothetical protein
MHARLAQAFGEAPADRIVFHLADVEAFGAEGRNAGHSVRRRTACHFPCGAERLIELKRAEFVYQGHHALGDVMLKQKGVVRGRDHVQQRVAHGGDVVRIGHFESSPFADKVSITGPNRGPTRCSQARARRWV